MDKLMLILFSLIVSVNCFAQTEEELVAEVKKVVLFPAEGQEFRTAKAMLNGDKQLLKIINLSPYIKKESIRVDGDGTFTILNVNYEVDYLNVVKTNERITHVNEKIKATQESIETLENQQTILKQKLDYFQANQGLNEKAALSAEHFKSISTYYMASVEKIRTENLKNTRQLRILKDSLTAFQRQLSELNSNTKQQPTGIISVLISSKVQRQAIVKLSYLVDRASWYPTYDFRFEGVNKPLVVSYKANMQQNTGFDWKNVQLSLSTTQTQSSATVPTMQPYYLGYYEPLRKTAKYDGYFNDDAVAVGYGMAKRQDLTGAIVKQEDSQRKMKAQTPTTQISQKQTSVSFDIQELQSLKSDGKNNLIRFQDTEIPCIYEYKSIPKLSDKVYLMGRIVDWYNLGLQSGDINLYFENAFVGSSRLNTEQFNDTLDVSFGVDQGISIKREKIKEFSSTSFFGTKKREMIGWKITVKNNKPEAVSIRIFDQTPISKNSEIKVNIIDISKGELNENTGELVWKVDLAARQSKEIILKYSVEYPKGKIVITD